VDQRSSESQLKLMVLLKLASATSVVCEGDREDAVEGRLWMDPPAVALNEATELIGALVDGRLTTTERATVIRLLAEDANLYAQFLDLARTTHELSLDAVDQTHLRGVHPNE